MRIRSVFAAATMITALAGGALVTSGPAMADTGATAGHHGTNSIDPADVGPCSGRVCISVVGDATGYTAFAKGLDFVGFVELFGPGLPRTAGPEGPNPTVSASGEGTGSVCALGWVRLPDGEFTPVIGMPCLPVP